MRYFLARLDDHAREREYRFYVTDMLRGFMAPNEIRYADIFKPVETRSAEEIKSSICAKLEVMGNGSEHI